MKSFKDKGDWIRRGIAGAAVLCLAATALAQDYTVTTATGKLETRPSGATQFTELSSSNSTSYAIIDLPFEFQYFGRAYAQIRLAPNGFLVPGNVGYITNSHTNYAIRGYDETSGAFPYSPQGHGGEAPTDGVIAPLWDDYACLHSGGCSGGDGGIYSWISGSAPNRRWVFSWERAGISTTTGRATVQVHLHEGSGQIVFAYDPNGTYSAADYVCGLDSYGDSRFVAPMENSRTNAGKPTSDFVFTPRTVTISGRVAYEKRVSDSTGIGNSVAEDQDLAGLDFELRRDGGILAASGRTTSDGTFSIRALGVAASSSASLHVIARNPAVRVATDPGNPVYEWEFASDLELDADSSLGTVTLDADGDSGATLRSAFNIAVQCGRTLGWVSARNTTPVAPVDAAFDDTLSRNTYFQPGSAGKPSTLVVAGKASPNPDAWDDAVVAHAYAREILGTLAGYPPTNADHRFDAPTTAQNAFAEGFGYALWRAVSGSSTVVDGKNATSATVHDLENPTLSSRDGTVAGAVAAGLHDAVDPANETTDVLDGTGVEDRLLTVVDALTVAPNAESFVQGWADAGFDAVALTRALIGAGALVDDADEPNDAGGETTSLGSLGVLRSARVLQRFNEDWYTVTLPDAVPALRADVAWDRSVTATTIALEIRDANGALVATGTPSATTGPYRAVTGPLGAGTYRIAVRHLTGAAIPAYNVQAYRPLQLAQAPLRNWTIGVAYSEPFGVVGGVPPYTLATPGAGMPPGLVANAAQLGGVGTPTTAGTFSVSVEARDAGSPQNVATVTQSVTIAAPVDIELPRFVGFPHGVSADTTLPVRGGTAPLTHDLSQGTLPEGLFLDPSTFRVTGTATTIGSSQVRFTARDAVGSTESVLATALVCPAGAPGGVVLDLAAEEASCGFYVDAVQGSTFGFSVKTAKGSVPRTLEATILGPDRAVVVGGKVKPKLGKVSGTKIPCERSGRYYVVVSSLSGDAAQLVAGRTVATPKRARGLSGTLVPGSLRTVEIGALPGAKLVFKASAPKRGDLVARCVGLVDPEGAVISPEAFVVNTKKGFTLKTELPIGGTWQVLVVGTPADASPGALRYSATMRAPRGSVYVAD